MATLLFTALGTALGGPIGGVLGALAGSQVDSALFGGATATGPRLKDLSVTTSTYGSAVARQFGTMRVGGTIIWATDLVEHNQSSGGGKNQPTVTTYSYTSSFAVAVSSRPIVSIGRVWADGTLLRGADGDMKVGGTLRIHTGAGDQQPDPLIAAAQGTTNCPAFRGMAYVVFEDLQLADFGNRIPTLTFEVLADSGALTLASLMDGVVDEVDADMGLTDILGYACEGPLTDTLSQFQPIMPMSCDAGGDRLTIASNQVSTSPVVLEEAAVSGSHGDFGAQSGVQRQRDPVPESPPRVLRYYDPALDYQPGTQRSWGQTLAGQPKTIEVPATMSAQTAARYIQQSARDANWSRETIKWRCAQLDPAVAPGVLVSPHEVPGLWRVTAWEWSDTGIALDLERVAPLASTGSAADAGQANLAIDQPVSSTSLFAYELPWDGQGSGDSAIVQAAASSSSAGWTGAALYADNGSGNLVWLAASGRKRSVTGMASSVLPAASPLLLDRQSQVTIRLTGADLALADASMDQLAMGANRALLGQEIIQFANARSLGSGMWQISGLMRGRGGTESAITSHQTGEAFILLDNTPTTLDQNLLHGATTIAAIGLADTAPVETLIACQGYSLRPWSPVWPIATQGADGSLTLAWTRRARGGWSWTDGVDMPLQEQSELYLVVLGGWSAPIMQWQVTTPALTLDPDTMSAIRSAHAGASIEVRQQGTYAVSEPLTLYAIS
ncbi:MAG: phage tail protein [Sphingomonadales bacterium]|nr:phage tail protein [Sphingomonadales bacterium]MDE2169027.1 phage tail protein [Sphingomonadales bacterium]